MEITNCTKQDFDQILLELNEFWGSDRVAVLHHPTLIYEFGNSAYVIRDGNKIAAYLFGFLSQTAPVGYIQFISVRPEYRKQGLGSQLYERFTRFALDHGCKQLKAITTPENKLSVAFHKSIGMMPSGEDQEDGVRIIRNYSGPGNNRVVFIKDIRK
jgi:GNAT superfamily N-acetyltransferase